MNRIFLDTNIVIDLLAKRKPFFEDAAAIFSLAELEKIELFISALSVANTHFILLKYMDSNKAKNILRNLRLIVKIINLDQEIIDSALNDTNFKDFEDAIQYYSAISKDVEAIITRNHKDFKTSKLPVMSSREYLVSL